MRFGPIALATVLALSLPGGAAEAVTIRDLIALARAGAADDTLIGLIEVDGTLFALDEGQAAWLKEQGLSDRVIGAMLATGRLIRRLHVEPAPPATEPVAPEPTVAITPAPQVIVIDHRDPTPPPQVVVIEHRSEPERILVPVYVPVAVPAGSRRSRSAARVENPTGRFINIGPSRLPTA